MKAALWTAADKIEIIDIPEPILKEGEVLIKVLGCGVCGTDVHIYHGEVPLAKPPQVLGHEVYGEIIEIGKGVKGFNKGQKISVDPVVGCGVCEFCQAGKTNLCPAPTIIGYARCGGFAQYTTVPAQHLYKVTEGLGAKAGIIAETLACVLNGYDRLNLKAGKSAMILGAGSVGLLWTALIKNSLITKLIQTEVIPFRGRLALKLGADFFVDANEPNFIEAVKAIEPNGIDYIIDTTGTSKAIAQSFPLLKRGGTFMIFGVCPEEERFTISPYEMFAKEISIIAAKMPPQTLGRAVQILEAGLVDCDTIVNATMPLENLQSAIHSFEEEKNKYVKIMMDPWG